MLLIVFSFDLFKFILDLRKDNFILKIKEECKLNFTFFHYNNWFCHNKNVFDDRKNWERKLIWSNNKHKVINNPWTNLCKMGTYRASVTQVKIKTWMKEYIVLLKYLVWNFEQINKPLMLYSLQIKPKK